MQRVRITLDFELEIPGEWQILGTEKPEPGCILVDGQRYEPGLTWMKVITIEDDFHESQPADDDTQFMFMDRITIASESVECL